MVSYQHDAFHPNIFLKKIVQVRANNPFFHCAHGCTDAHGGGSRTVFAQDRRGFCKLLRASLAPRIVKGQDQIGRSNRLQPLLDDLLGNQEIA